MKNCPGLPDGLTASCNAVSSGVEHVAVTTTSTEVKGLTLAGLGVEEEFLNDGVAHTRVLGKTANGGVGAFFV